ncbi:uncharacterized protein LOC120572363 isoform X3 [Perca fluviatilis]|uniref:uncharacterized protein LOC120572363 isoform X3 n=1 Tax=Perca fluviatilis TaxID=8168 RepID=UPI0019647392|nr:uncharacterized protein LOC120572363 isoform X3 [Perca fluviatilis]
MQEGTSCCTLAHFASNTRVNKDSKLLLLLENHASHLPLGAIDYCRENGIVLLFFPPHCTHRLQPMACSVFGPLKTYINSAADQWMRGHPGINLCIYDVPSVVAAALPLAAQASNVISGFSGTGIWPFNPEKFNDDDFAPSYVTDRPPPKALSPAGDEVQEAGNATPVSDEEFSPEIVRPFPKAGSRKTTMRKGRKRTTAILTDSPVRAALEEAKQRRPKPSSKPSQQYGPQAVWCRFWLPGSGQ